MAQVIGFIGLGIMGRPVAGNPLRAGCLLVVHSRSRGSLDEPGSITRLEDLAGAGE